jgi:hypothetical protein
MSKKKLTDILIFVSVFISSVTFFNSPFEGYLHYVIFLVYLPFFVSQFGIPKMPFQILFLPFVIGIGEILMGNDTLALFAKIFIGVFLSTTFYYYVIQYYEMDVERIFALYLRGAVLASYIGIVQYLSYLIHFSPGYNFHWLFNKWGLVQGGFGIRVNSIFSEPSQCAIVLTPAAFVAIYNIFFRKRLFLSGFESGAILVTLVLTTSSTGFIGLFVIAILLTLNYGKIINLIVGIGVIALMGRVLYEYVPDFRSRVDTSVGLWGEEKFTIENINSSSFVLYNNYHVALENFKQNFLFGTGLGSHPIAFEKYSLTKRADILDIHFNVADANSMFIRLMSETGLMGLIFFYLFITRLFVRRNLFFPDSNFWIISNAFLVIIILYLLRQGNYFLNGFPLFMWMYFYTSLKYKEMIDRPSPHLSTEK